MRRINDKSKLIPILIGDVNDADIPESLKPVVWERIGDLNNYDAEFDRIVGAIYEHQEKPPLGEPPAYTRNRIDSLPGLTAIDTLVLKICCEHLIQSSDTIIDIINPRSIFDQAKSMEIGEQNVLESAEVLDSRGYLDVKNTNEGNIFTIKVTAWGFEDYARSYIPGYEDAYRSVALEIVNRDVKDRQTIAKVIEQPEVIVDHIIRQLASRDMLKIQQFPGGGLFIHTVPAALKRWLQEQ